MSRTTITRIYNRHDTAENWEAKNPILGVGEIGYDETYKYMKIGDGVTAWNDLPIEKNTKLFENLPWSKIAEISEAGEARKYFNIGDTKTIELSTGEEIEVRIIGFNHDLYSEESRTAGITCEMVNVLEKTYEMNNTSTNAGGWDECEIRTSTLPTILSQLPSDLQAVIKTVNKKASAGSRSSDIVTSEDKLFLFAMSELYSRTAIESSSFSNYKSNAATYIQEGWQYEYYADVVGDQDPSSLIANMIKKRPTAATWWLRTPSLADSNSFIRVNYRGGVDDYLGAINTGGVSFGFCV